MTDHETFLLLAAKQIGERLSTAEEASLTAHLEGCPSCRAMVVAMRRDDILLRGELGAASVSPTVRRRVLDEAAGRRHIDWRPILGLVAALLIAGIGVPLLAGGSRSDQPSPVPTLGSTAPSPSVALASPSASGSPRPSGSPPSASPGPASYVDGAYVYGTTPPKRDTIAVRLEGGRPVGEWSRREPAVGDAKFYGGPITCLIVDGQDAWMAGPATTATDGTTDRAAMLYVHDGGPGGGGDLVVLWLSTPGQTITTMVQWCERRQIPAGPYPLTSGDVTVTDAGG
jgi:hypothetical protein